jgi:hypothetical protein
MPQHILTSKLTSNPSTTGTLPHKAILTTPHLKLIKDQSLAAISQERSPEETTNNLCHADCQQLLRGGQDAVGCFHQQALPCRLPAIAKTQTRRCKMRGCQNKISRSKDIGSHPGHPSRCHRIIIKYFLPLTWYSSHPREVLSKSLRSSVTPNGAS